MVNREVLINAASQYMHNAYKSAKGKRNFCVLQCLNEGTYVNT